MGAETGRHAYAQRDTRIETRLDSASSPPKIPGYVVGRLCGAGRTGQVYKRLVARSTC